MSNKIVNQSYPFLLLKKWLKDAENSYNKLNFNNYNAAVLSTVSLKNQPSSRVILVKEINEKSLIFYTNLGSKKVQEIHNNNLVSLLFYWESIKKQIRIEGKLQPVLKNKADEYFKSRPYLSKIGAWASKQSKEMENRAEFKKRIAKYILKYKLEVPRPEFWSGFCLIPNYFEFWKEIKFRLHKRISYTKAENGYRVSILYP